MMMHALVPVERHTGGVVIFHLLRKLRNCRPLLGAHAPAQANMTLTKQALLYNCGCHHERLCPCRKEQALAAGGSLTATSAPSTSDAK